MVQALTQVRPETASKLMKMVNRFEGGGVAGDFDGALLSFGPLQWNVGSGTLRPLLADFAALPRGAEILGVPMVRALQSDAAFKRFVQDEVLDPNNRYANGGRKPKPYWTVRLMALYELPEAWEIFGRHAAPYLAKAVANAQALGFVTERGLALCFDIAVQNGDIRWDHYKLYRANLRPFEYAEWQRLKVLAHAVADCANPQWHDDVLSRKLTIALGSSRTSGMRVHGADIDLLRDFGISYHETWQAPA